MASLSTSMATDRFRRFREFTGIDFHVGTTLLFRIWLIFAGAVMVFAIPTAFSPEQQGFYFTFSSLLALQIFFELGLNQVIVQIVSHEVAYLSFGKNGEIIGDRKHADRLKSVVTLIRRWYGGASFAFLLFTLLVGIYIFDRNATLTRQQWVGPWIALVATSAINLYFSSMLAVIEGCGLVGEVARLRLFQSILGYSITWVALYAGVGLWAISSLSGCAAVCTFIWIRSDNHLVRKLREASIIAAENTINWRREVLPFQWRIAVSWISGYLIYQLFTPLVFVNLGSIEAGRIGITLAIFNSLMSVGISWINAKIPLFTKYIARNERHLLNSIFHAVVLRSVSFTTATSGIVVLTALVAEALNYPYINRVAAPATMLCIAVSTSLTTLVYALAAYMRAHREEPMLPVSVAGGVTTLVSAYFAARHGVLLTMLVQTCVTLFISVPWTLRLFRRYHRRLV